MEISLSLLCLSLLTLASLIFVVKKINRSRGRLKLPPSPPSLPIIGNLHQLGKLPHRSLHQLSQKYGPVMFLRFGLSEVIVISSSEGAEEVLKAHDLETCSRPKLVGTKLLSRGFKDIGSTPYSEQWREMRKIGVLELLSQKKVQSFRVIREEENNLLVKKLSESAVNESPVDLSKTLFWLTASITFRVAFGQNFHESKFMEKDRIEELVFQGETILASFTASDFFPAGVGWLIDWLSGQNKRLDEIFVELDTFFQNVIDDHLKHGRTKEDNPDFVDAMLKKINKQGGNDSLRLTIDHMKAVFANIFLAGIDTGAITMIWAMTELARNPALMKKVQDDIRRCIGKKEVITEEDIDQLHYLKCVIKETLRLHPPAPLLLPRETMAQIKIQGYDIPPKMRLQLNAWAIGQDPKHWTNPEEFNPERFIDSPIDYKGQHFELLPFGSGRRICPGMAMGIATVELTLTYLLYFFNWKLPDGMTERDINMEEIGTLTVVKKVPLELVPVRYHE